MGENHSSQIEIRAGSGSWRCPRHPPSQPAVTPWATETRMVTVHAEQLEIAGFLAQHPPFNELPETTLHEIAQQVEISYYRAGRDILQFREPIQDLYVVRSGVVETFRRTGELYNRLGEGGIFGQLGLMMNRRVRFPVKALEDTLLYCIPVTLFNELCDRFDTFADYFEAEDDALLRLSLIHI